VITYQFFLLAGCVVAFHYEAFQAWISSHSRLIWWGLARLGGARPDLVRSQPRLRAHPGDATGVLQPEMLPWYCFVVLALYLVGSRALGRPPAGRLPLAAPRRRRLAALLRRVPRAPGHAVGVPQRVRPVVPQPHPPGLPLTVSAYVFAVVTSLIFVEIVIRTPLAKVLQSAAPAIRRPSRCRPSPSRSPRKPAFSTVNCWGLPASRDHSLTSSPCVG